MKKLEQIIKDLEYHRDRVKYYYEPAMDLENLLVLINQLTDVQESFDNALTEAYERGYEEGQKDA